MGIEIKTFNQLDLSDYEGYCWYSNAEYPKQNSFKPLIDGEIPFVIEGFLYNHKKKLSISIKNYNGKYLINQFDLSRIDGNLRLSADVKSYPAYSSKLTEVKTLKFIELQEKITDEMKFSYWKKVVNIFVGFVKK